MTGALSQLQLAPLEEVQFMDEFYMELTRPEELGDEDSQASESSWQDNKGIEEPNAVHTLIVYI